MPFHPAQRHAIDAIRDLRSAASYFAGSAVLTDVIGREPGDLDIHHSSLDDAFAARATDLRVLAGQGFVLCHSTDYPEETEAVLRHPLGEVTINWVSDHSPHLDGPQPHENLGFALSVADVHLIKLMTALDFRRPKDLRDLDIMHRSGYRAPSRAALSRSLARYREDPDIVDRLLRFMESLGWHCHENCAREE